VHIDTVASTYCINYVLFYGWGHHLCRVHNGGGIHIKIVFSSVCQASFSKFFFSAEVVTKIDLGYFNVPS